MSEVVVVGSANMDLVATAARLPRPGETVLGRDFATVPGGKGANQAAAAARAGGSCAMVGAVGSDAFGTELRDALSASGVDVTGLRREPGPSGVALIAVADDGENSIVVAPGANATVTDLTVGDRALIAGASVVVCQLEIPLTAVTAAGVAAQAAGARFVLNAAPVRALPGELLSLVDLLVVNEVEARMLTGLEGADASELIGELLWQVPRVVLTLGAAGAQYGDTSVGVTSVPAPAVTAVDTTGAGDATVGALACAWAEDRDLVDAVRWACAAGSLAVQRVGATSALPYRAEIDELYEVTYR